MQELKQECATLRRREPFLTYPNMFQTLVYSYLVDMAKHILVAT